MQTHTMNCEKSKHKRTSKVTSLFDLMKFSKPTIQKASVFLNLLFPTLPGCIKTSIINKIQIGIPYKRENTIFNQKYQA